MLTNKQLAILSMLAGAVLMIVFTKPSYQCIEHYEDDPSTPRSTPYEKTP
jgi:hypothetical protein